MAASPAAAAAAVQFGPAAPGARFADGRAGDDQRRLDEHRRLDAGLVRRAGVRPYLLGGSNTTYVLETNVTVPGTAFFFGGSNNTLNLNGYTVTYDNAAPITVANGGFEQGSGTNVPGWNLSAAPSAAIAPNNYYLWGNQVLQFRNLTGTQTILSAPIAIPAANYSYAATISCETINASTVTLSVVDSVTGAVLASSSVSETGEGIVAASRRPPPIPSVCRSTVAANGTDTVELDQASLNVAGDYGMVASTDWYDMPSQLANALPNWDQIQPAMAAVQNLTICNGSIVQGQANGYGSLPIYAAYMPGLTIQNVNTLSTGIDTGAVYAAYSSNGLVISDCVFRNTVQRGRQSQVDGRRAGPRGLRLGAGDRQRQPVSRLAANRHLWPQRQQSDDQQQYHRVELRRRRRLRNPRSTRLITS